MQNLGDIIRDNIDNLIRSKIEEMSSDIDSTVNSYLDKLFSGNIYGAESLVVVGLDRLVELNSASAMDRKMAYSNFSRLFSSEVSTRLSKKIDGFRIVCRFMDLEKTSMSLTIVSK